MRLCVVLLLAALLVGCRVEFNRGSQEQARAGEGTASDQAAVKDASAIILAQIDAGNWTTAWENSASTLKQSTTRTALELAVNGSRAAFGSPGARRITGYTFTESIEGAPPGQYGIAFFTTDFSRASGVEEQVVLRKESNEWKLAGYWAEKSAKLQL